MGALPNKLPGGQDVEDPELRAKFERAWGAPIPPQKGMHLSQMFEAMEHGTLQSLFVIGENPVQSEADQTRAIAAARGPRAPRRAGHVPDEDGRDRARRAAGGRLVVRGRRDRDLERAPRAARAQGPRAARAGARGPRDPRGPRAQPRHRLGTSDGRGSLERAARPLALARRDELRAPRGAATASQWPCPDESHPGQPLPARAPLGGPGRGAARALPRRSSTTRRSTSSTRSSRSA